MATYISSIKQLRTEVSDRLGAEATEDDVDIVIDDIRSRPERPAFGDDWQPFLETLDLWGIVESRRPC